MNPECRESYDLKVSTGPNEPNRGRVPSNTIELNVPIVPDPPNESFDEESIKKTE